MGIKQQAWICLQSLFLPFDKLMLGFRKFFVEKVLMVFQNFLKGQVLFLLLMARKQAMVLFLLT